MTVSNLVTYRFITGRVWAAGPPGVIAKEETKGEAVGVSSQDDRPPIQSLLPESESRSYGRRLKMTRLMRRCFEWSGVPRERR